MASAGDVNADGFDDVVIGAPGLRGSGGAFLFLGSAAGPSGSPDWAAVSAVAGDAFGASVASAGDVNGDGFDDLVIGAPRQRPDQEASGLGDAYLYLGTPTGLEAAPAWSTHGGVPDGHCGSTVAGPGDVDADGYADVAVACSGEMDEYRGGSPDAAVLVFLGSPLGPTAAASWRSSTWPVYLDWSELRVAPAGDVNADGYDDLAIGSMFFVVRRTRVHLGSASGLAQAPAWSVDDHYNTHGHVAATAGDVDGDGRSDLVVGGEAVNDYANLHGASDAREHDRTARRDPLGSAPAPPGARHRHPADGGGARGRCGRRTG